MATLRHQSHPPPGAVREEKKPWIIPDGTPPSRCRGCEAKIYFVPYVDKAGNDKYMPVDPGGMP
ncbi:MAG: hypothetical protein FWE89_04235 [Syntrophaceae bacterium]|nr:hypothetical protein [Syntrophaceae bacterium]